MKKIFLLLLISAFSWQVNAQTAVISSPDPSVCLGEEACLSSANSTAGSSPIVNSIWSIISPGCNFNLSGNSAPGENFCFTPTCVGTYDISLINQYSNGTTSQTQEQAFITVNNNVSANISAAVSSCNIPFAVQYGVGGSSSGADITYAWTFQNGNPPTFSGANPPLINYSTVGTYDVTLVVTNSQTGCTATATRSMNVQNFATSFASPATACVGESVQLTDNSTVGANSWTWSATPGFGVTGTGNFSSTGAQDPTVSFTAPGTYTINLSSSNTSVPCNGSSTATIEILPLPTPSFTLNPTTGCAPLSVNFTNTSTNATGATFSWNYGDGTAVFNGQNSPSHLYTGNGSFTTTLTMEAANGCTATATQSVTLTSPVACFTQIENNLCEPKNVSFDPSCSTAPGDITSYIWIWDDGSPNTTSTTPDVQDHDYLCGKYTPRLVITMANGCRDTVSGTEIKVGTTLDVGFEADTLLQCIKKPINLHSTTIIDCPHDDSDLIYFWEFESVPEAGDSTKIKIFPDTMLNVTYATDVALEIDFRGCKSKDSIIDYIYIKAPVSRFSLDELLFCDLGQSPAPLGKVVNVNDLQSIYHHSSPIDHSLVPPLGSNIETVPDSTTDNPVTVTYKWGDGTPNTTLTDIDIEDADKGATSHTFDNYGTFEVWQIIHNSGTECYDSTSVTVHVSWIETQYVFDIAGPDSVCIGTPFEFTSTTGTHGMPAAEENPHTPVSYVFDMVSGGNVTGSGSTVNQTFSHTYNTAGVYDVELTATNSVGCSATHTENITAFALPIADFTLDVTNGCLFVPYTTTATNTSTHPEGSYTEGSNSTGWLNPGAFTWTINGGTPQIIDTYNPSISTSVTQNTNITLQVTDAFGCVSIPVTRSANVQQPTASVNLTSQICNSNVQNGTISFNGNGNIQSYVWIIDGVSSPASNISSFPFPPTWVIPEGGPTSQSHTVGLIVTDDLGCRDTLNPVQSVTVLSPIAGFTDERFGTATGNPNEFNCPPVVVNFTDASQTANSAPITNWAWHLNIFDANLQGTGALTTTQQSPQGIQYLFAGTYDLTMIVQDAAGCIDTLFIDDYLVIQGPSGTPTITQVAGICGQIFDFDLSGTNNVASWSWELGDGTTVESATEPDNNFNHDYQGVTTYYPVIYLRDALGCTVPYTDTVVITPNGVDAVFTFAPDVINIGSPVTFDPSGSTSTTNITQYNWSFGDGTTDSTFNNTTIDHIYEIGGEIPVTLTVTDDRGCTDTYTQIFDIDVNFKFPNVFTGKGSDGPNAELSLALDFFKDFEFLVVNRWGNVVYEGKRDASKPRYLWDGIDVKSNKLCNDGTYFYRITGTLKNDEYVDLHGFITLIATTRP